MKNYTLYFNQFKEGDERGLAFFYRLWYPKLYYWGFKYIKDDLNADCIVSEAFLRLWLARRQIASVEQLERFVKQLIADACRAYYRTPRERFQRSMLRLDELENEQVFLGAEPENYDWDGDVLGDDRHEQQQNKQWAQVTQVIPNLKADQQLFVRLCLKYSFDYERIAWHIGGLSDHQVLKKVEQLIRCLRNILSDTKQLDREAPTRKLSLQGDISERQSAILRMRYELRYSFEEIARAMQLEQGEVQLAFVEAMKKVGCVVV